MPQKLKVLIAEDRPEDAELLLRRLRQAGFEPDWERVDSEAAFRERLNDGLDIVISDYEMPQFNGERALELLKQSGLDIPFIIVSGTIGEDTAVSVMKMGATDYLLKDRLARLGSAVTHALNEKRMRTEQRRAEAEVQRQRKELEALFELMPAMIWFKDTQNRILRINGRAAATAGKTVTEIEGKLSEEIYPEMSATFYRDDLEVIRTGIAKLGIVETLRSSTGSEMWVQTDKVPVRDRNGKVAGIIVMAQDITERKRADLKIREQLDELLRWQDVMLAREDRVQELKLQVNDLLGQMGQPARYSTPPPP